VRKSGGPDLRARSKDTGDNNAKATSNAVAGQGALHTEDRVVAQRIVNDLGVEPQYDAAQAAPT
jgi:hypothetical protein